MSAATPGVVLLRRGGQEWQVPLETQPLGRGGEGAVWRIAGATPVALPGPLVVKLFHDALAGSPVPDRAAKVAAMVAAPPATDAICWPLAEAWLPATGAGPARFAGFAMPALDESAFRLWAQLANARDRRAAAPKFGARYALVAARNLALTMAAVHGAGHCLGDVNESNVFIGADATVRIVDADSAQVRAADGTTFRCLVGKPEYTAPELAGRPLRDQDRTPGTDALGFAVLVFQLLTGGAHPTDGAAIDTSSEPPSVTERLAAGWLPALRERPGCPLRPLDRVPTAGVPTRLRSALAAALDPDPAHRPTLSQLAAVLDDIGTHLVDCTAVPGHAYDRREGGCGWCAAAARGADPWAPAPAAAQPGTASNQQALPQLTFGQQPTAVPVRRAAPVSLAHPAGPLPTGVPPTAHPALYAASNYPALHPGGGYPPVGNVGGHLGGYPGRSAPPAAVTPAAYTGKTLLRDETGQLVERPPMWDLLRAQPGLALSVAWAEFPARLKPFAPRTTSRSGGPVALWVLSAAAGAAAVAAVSWFGLPLLCLLLEQQLRFQFPASALTFAVLGAWVGESVALTVTAVSFLRRRPRMFSRGDAAHVAQTAALYGPGLVIGAAAAAAAGCLWLVLLAANAISGNAGRR